MLYLSKGIAKKNSTAKSVQVLRGGQCIGLSETEADVWLNGRFSFSCSKTPTEDHSLQRLIHMGLAEGEPEENGDAGYWILTRCICCPAQAAKSWFGLSATEKTILFWLINAGIRLSTAELIYLLEYKIKATPDLLYPQNRQSLIETIYTADTIADNILENQMAAAKCRDGVIQALLSLLKKKKIWML